jgi:predicted ArsR family transcriptional regulator
MANLNSSIPDDVRRFVLTCIPSIPMMEAALLFHEAQDVPRSVSDVASCLYLPEHAALGILQDLSSIGLIQAHQGRFVYAPRDETVANLVGAAARAYRENLIGMTRLIHDQTSRNATRFADAFKIRKDT